MSRLLSRVVNSIHLRQILVKCVKHAGQPPFLQRFRRSMGQPLPVLNNVRAILSFFTCRRRPDVSGTPRHATQNIFEKNSSSASFSQRIRFHTRKNRHSCQKQPWRVLFLYASFGTEQRHGTDHRIQLRCTQKERITHTIRLSCTFAFAMMMLGLLVFQLIPDKLLLLFNASEDMISIGSNACASSAGVTSLPDSVLS